MLGGLLPEGMMFPFDFGFLPATLGGDGDLLDIMVLMDAPAHVGCLIEVRIIGSSSRNRPRRAVRTGGTGTGGPKKAMKFRSRY